MVNIVIKAYLTDDIRKRGWVSFPGMNRVGGDDLSQNFAIVAEDNVCPLATDDPVVAVIPEADIVTTRDVVLAVITKQLIGSLLTVEEVVSSLPMQDIIACTVGVPGVN
jgi:hypothetical protein